MKTWATPVVEELSVKETAHNWFGIYRDGGYIGDGEISGHLSWTKPGNKPETKPETKPENDDYTDLLS